MRGFALLKGLFSCQRPGAAIHRRGGVSPLKAPFPFSAANAFRSYFDELRGTYLEREALFEQLELALLCREHLLITGPPGTAKSAIAGEVLGRILDQQSGAPSLFSKQLSESTVQTDLIGPVDFKVLTQTGRTEHLTDEGMLGSRLAFLDEVFDGREMLLRSILNVLHEREVKQGQKVTRGRCECVVMTSNRTLSEVLASSPELLLAFADRLSFVSFCPKSFARTGSRGAMLERASAAVRPVLDAKLTLQQLSALQVAVEEVEVGSAVVEGLLCLATHLERELLEKVSRLPGYVPTKYFSQRSMVKALWALKAAVVRDRIYRRPDRPLVATVSDLAALRRFFLLGGPASGDIEVLLTHAADPRERAQLEIIRLEQRAFEAALAQVPAEVRTASSREAVGLLAAQAQADADGLVGSFRPEVATGLGRSLRARLWPGPRYPENRRALVAAARTLTLALEQRLARGAAAPGAGRAGVGLLPAVTEGLELIRAVPELEDRRPAVCGEAVAYLRGGLELVALYAEGTAFDEALSFEALVSLVGSLADDFDRLAEAVASVSAVQPEAVGLLAPVQAEAKRRTVEALIAQARGLIESVPSSDPLQGLSEGSHRLGRVEERLEQISPGPHALKARLLTGLARAYAQQALEDSRATQVSEYAARVQAVWDTLTRVGLVAAPFLVEQKEVIARRLLSCAQGRAHQAAVAPPGADAYQRYQKELAPSGTEGELKALVALTPALAAAGVDPAPLRAAVAQAELSYLDARVGFLDAWSTLVLSGLPRLEQISSPAEANRAFDRLVKTRFPLLAIRDGELLRLQEGLRPFLDPQGGLAKEARALEGRLRALTERFASFSAQLLQARARG